MVWTYEVCLKGEDLPFRQVSVIGFDSVREMLEKQHGRPDIEVRVIEPRHAARDELDQLKAMGVAIAKAPSAQIASRAAK